VTLSNDAENLALITGINYTLFRKTVILDCNNISQYYRFYGICDEIKAVLVSKNIKQS